MRRDDINSILILGAGPIVIGQACEFDYSGAQACKVLREEGYRTILVNSNPATIMTDPGLADATYIEPVHWEIVSHIIEKERPDAILPTMGGQTALNCALDLQREGVLEKFNVEMIGADGDAIRKAEDRELFGEAMERIGLATCASGVASNMEQALEIQAQVGYPTIIRPSFTMGGAGGGIAYNREEFEDICRNGFELSPTNELLIETSILGWKEYEMEVVRDKNDNVIIVCSIENIDPMGVHTGDSITVAPAQTLTDREYQRMRDASIAVLREIGVDTGGSNVQFALHPETGELIVIEMNPRVSRSSALASKATGFPIAKVAAKLAVGYTLDELRNEITGGVIPCSFEPALDYVVTKIPRFNFEKFPGVDSRLTTSMKSVGEVMAIGRTFQESLQKALCSLETGMDGLDPMLDPQQDDVMIELRRELRIPGANRLWYVADAFRAGLSVEQVYELSSVDPWYLIQLQELVELEAYVQATGLDNIEPWMLRQLKRKGFSDRRLATLSGTSETVVRDKRHQFDLVPVYKRVDSCAGEFASKTAYLYSTYEEECEARASDKKKIMVLGGGPNRIGQGIEFDYCCVHAVLGLRAEGYETIMVNCNPETVSTDYDTADRLYFEPLTLENVLAIVDIEKPDGVIVQFGGQTPLKLARDLEALGVPIIGTSPDAIDRAEDRDRFQQMIEQLQLRQPPSRLARTEEEGIELSKELTYPLLVRPSYVLGGRAMEIVYNESELSNYLARAVKVSNDSPVLLDTFLESAVEVDVDAVCDGENVIVAGIMEHIEQAGVHSGDSSCVLPPHQLSKDIQVELKRQMQLMAKTLGVVGLMNAQFAIQEDEIYVLEVNPRASRTVPFVSKAMGLPFAQIAARCMVGISLEAQQVLTEKDLSFYAVKGAVFPFAKLPAVDPILGPEMKSTGEVMGIGQQFGEAFAKCCLGSGFEVMHGGRAFLSVRDQDKPHIVELGRGLIGFGFELVATAGTMKVLQAAGLPCDKVNKVTEGRPHVVDMIKNDEIDFIVNTTEGRQAISDSYTIRSSAVQHKVSYITTLAGAQAVLLALIHEDRSRVTRLQDLHKDEVVA